jgi:hypothetical protein
MTLDESAQGCSSKVLNSGVAEDRSRLLCWQVGGSPPWAVWAWVSHV